jgi:serine/threonine protein kinase
VLAPGDVVGDVYQLLHVLGTGATAFVFEAEDRRLERRVAVKVAHPLVSLRAEARTLAAVIHPSLPAVHELGTEGLHDYLVMERVAGVTLAEHLKGPLPPEEVIRLLTAMADGLGAIHRAGMSHRDVKPANIMLAPGGRVVFLDFGLVHPEHLTGVTAMPGFTLEYAAPELLQQKVQSSLGHLVDLFALGAIAYELLTGTRRFPARDPVAALVSRLRAGVVEMPGPPPLVALVRELLAKDPLERPQSTDAVLFRLRELSGRALARRTALTVLIADSEATPRHLLERAIAAAMPSARVHIATDAGETLRLIRSASPDVILLDLEGETVGVVLRLRGTNLAARCTIISTSRTALDPALLERLGVTRTVPKGKEFPRRVLQVLAEIGRSS